MFLGNNQELISKLTSVLKVVSGEWGTRGPLWGLGAMGSGEWGTRGPLWGLGAMGSGVERLSLFAVCPAHGESCTFLVNPCGGHCFPNDRINVSSSSKPPHPTCLGNQELISKDSLVLSISKIFMSDRLFSIY